MAAHVAWTSHNVVVRIQDRVSQENECPGLKHSMRIMQKLHDLL